jgi:phosphoglycerate dehydrogenase-like enzyme
MQPRICLLLLAYCITGNHTVAAPSSEATALIEELGLRAAAQPVSKHPGWDPQRVVIALMPTAEDDSLQVEQRMRAVAGDVELVFDRTGNPVLSRELLAGTDGIIGMCLAPVLKRADSRLLWLHNYSVGMDYCKGYSETQLEQVVFTNNKRLSGPAIAEHTIAMLLSLSNRLPDYSRAQSKGKWDTAPARKPSFGELKGKTLLVVGLGGIGTEVAWRAHGLGMRVIGIRNSSRSGPTYVEHIGLPDELHTLAAKADVVVNALPLTPDTTNIFNKAFFASTKRGAIFLSVGRGQSTVTADLISALNSGQLFGAGLDVTEPEPLPQDSPLWQMENVIITPHISARGPDSLRRTMIIAVENLRRYVAGEPMLNVVDIKRGY